MSLIDKWINVLERINEINLGIMRIPLLPYYIIDSIYDDIKLSRKRKKEKREEERDPKYQIRKRLEAGELRLCDLPHQHIEASNSFAFYPNPDKEFYAHQFFYLAMEPDERIRRFFEEEKEAIARWSSWYGFEIIMVEDVEEFLSDMCFPQDRVYLRHGLMRNGAMTTSDREYWQSIRPFTYHELDADSPTPLIEQLNRIVQDVLRNPY